MEYTVNRLSKLAGISARTLRYYDQIGLLKPHMINKSGYRLYGEAEIDRLQQILFYRELGMGLNEIKAVVTSPAFDRQRALEDHMSALKKERERLNRLIKNVQNTLLAMKGETKMNDEEKFEGLKQSMVAENEQKYGKEIREKYGDETVDASNRVLKNMPREKYEESVRLSSEIDEALKAAVKTGNPKGPLARKAVELHGQWLAIFNPTYCKEYHLALGEMYVSDERFTAYYERIAGGCAAFLRDAIREYFD